MSRPDPIIVTVGVLAAVLIAAFIATMAVAFSTSSALPPSPAVAGASAQVLDMQEPPLTDEQRLAEAARMLDGARYFDGTTSLKVHLLLDGLSPTAAKQPAARRALAQLVKVDKASAESRRDDYARKLDRTLLDEGIEATVRLGGDDKTTLRIESFICGRVFLHKTFDTDEAVAALRTLGFKRVVCATAFETTTLTL